ncbi:CD63 antigen [Austrofundulus limnaeus]|uniref:Tetraspanin n=1 Tax=Austrofundulus limnaeus TaxID=52670 RepID=A0A2I4BVE1_AUSLI|nr:PREDICTED: CD63 antigen [Austrofundulus limnaeus]
MAVEGGMKCVKYLLFFFNFIFWLCGFALIVVGVMVQVSLNKTLLIKDVSASAGPIVIISVGVLVFFIAFFGCCGAWKENQCMVVTFAVLLSLIIIAEIAAAILGYVFRNKISKVVQDSLTDMINKYGNSSKETQDAVDKLQETWKCCGVNSSSDWKNFSPDGGTVPDSCCLNVTKNCGKGTMTDASKVYQKGCHDVLETFIRNNIQWVIIAAVVIAVLQVLGVVFACLLVKSIRSEYEVM